jgi:hypothetical protein
MVAIADADPAVVCSGELDASSEQLLTAAWRASSVISRLATLATEKHLPIWTTG